MIPEFEPNYRIPVNTSAICERAFELMYSKQFDEAEKLLNSNMSKVDDDVSVAIFHSALGILYKLKGEMKTAWKHYQRAEKLIPDDPALKIIVARLLIGEFAEYDQAIKRAKKVLELIPENPVFAHQAYTTLGLAYLGKGNRKKTIEMFNKSMEVGFEHFVTTQNIDFHLVEMLLRRGWGVAEARVFLNKAHEFALKTNEDVWIEVTQRMLSAFPEEETREEETRG